MRFSARTLHSLQLCLTDFYSCRFLHIVTELCWPVRMKSLCVSGRELSSRPEFSSEMSLSLRSLRVLCCGLHFFFFFFLLWEEPSKCKSKISFTVQKYLCYCFCVRNCSNTSSPKLVDVASGTGCILLWLFYHLSQGKGMGADNPSSGCTGLHSQSGFWTSWETALPRCVLGTVQFTSMGC